MPLSPAQREDAIRKVKRSRALKRRLDLASGPDAKSNQKIAQGLMQRRRARQQGRM